MLLQIPLLAYSGLPRQVRFDQQMLSLVPKIEFLDDDLLFDKPHKLFSLELVGDMHQSHALLFALEPILPVPSVITAMAPAI